MNRCMWWPVMFALVASLVVISPPARASSIDHGQTLVSEMPSGQTPQILDGRAFAVAEWGDLVVVGGDFQAIADPGETPITQPNLFAFDKATGLIDTQFLPSVNGSVRAVLPHPDGTTLLIGGEFTTVGGIARRGVARIDPVGEMLGSWAAETDGTVLDLGYSNGVVYAAGSFSSANGVPRPALAGFSPDTGTILAEIDLDIAEPRNGGGLLIRRIDISPDGTLLAGVGNFGRVDGQERDQVLVVDLTTSPDTLHPWATRYYDVPCADIVRWPYHVRDVEFSPDSSYLVIANSGGKPVYPHRCDQGARFELDQVGPDVAPTWVTYSGGDSVLAVAATEDAIYLGGHYRWLNNPYGQDEPEPGAVARGTLAALDPLTGLPYDWNPGRSPRGQGVLAIEAVDDGIWIASDTDFLAEKFRPRIAFMPLAGGTTIHEGTPPSLPAVLFTAANGDVMSHGYDGSVITSTSTIVTDDSRFEDITGATLISGALFASRATVMDEIGWQDGPVGDRAVDLHGLTLPLADIGGLTFDFDLRRLYYTTSDGVLRWRHFEPDQAILGAEEFTTPTGGLDFSSLRGMTIVEGSLLYGSPSGDLRRVDWIDGAPQGPATIVSGPGVDGRSWSSPTLFAFSPGDQFLATPDPTLLSVSGFGSDTVDPWQTFSFVVPSRRDLDVAVSVADAAADLRFFLYNPSGNLVDAATTAGATRQLFAADAGPGTWSIGVRSRGAGSAFDLTVNAPRGDEPIVSTLSSCGSMTAGKWQTMPFAATAGDPITLDLDWDDPAAEIYTFIIDPSGTTVEGSRTPGVKPRTVTTTATTTGSWTAAVNFKAGSACFDLTATVGAVTTGPTVSTLSSCGSVTVDKWQTMPFAAAIGDPITLDLDWDDPAAEIYTFIIDPSGTTVEGSRTPGTKPRHVTTTATMAGSWTAAVNFKAGSACFDLTATVGVAATNQPPVIDPIADVSVAVGAPVDVAVTASDPDGDSLTFSAAGLPTGLTIDPATGQITGTVSAATTSSITVTVSDGIATVDATFVLTVSPVVVSDGTRITLHNVGVDGYLDAPVIVAITSATTSASTTWVVDNPDGDSKLALRNEATGRYLDGDAGGVDTFINADRDDRQWYLDLVAPGQYRLRNAETDRLVEAVAVGASVGWDTAPPEADDLWEVVVVP